jgi:hypothetical protein
MDSAGSLRSERHGEYRGTRAARTSTSAVRDSREALTMSFGHSCLRCARREVQPAVEQAWFYAARFGAAMLTGAHEKMHAVRTRLVHRTDICRSRFICGEFIRTGFTGSVSLRSTGCSPCLRSVSLCVSGPSRQTSHRLLGRDTPSDRGFAGSTGCRCGGVL